MAFAPRETTGVTQRELAILSDSCTEAQELARHQIRPVEWLEQARLGALPWWYDGKLGPEDQAEEAAIKKNERSPSLREAKLKDLRARARAEAKRIWKNRRALTLDWCDQVLLYKQHRVRIAALHPSDRANAVRELMAARLDPDPAKLATLEIEAGGHNAIQKHKAKERQLAGFLARLASLGLAPRSTLQLTKPFAQVSFNRYSAQPIACLEEYADRVQRFWRDIYDAFPELNLFSREEVRRIVLTSKTLAVLANEKVWQTRRAVPTDSLYVPDAG